MNTQTKPAADAASMAHSLTVVSAAVSAFDKIGAGLAALRQEHPLDVTADPATKDGMALLKAGHKAWRSPRIELEKKRTEAKAPVIALGRDIDAFAAVLKAQLEEGETHYFIQIDTYNKEQERIAAEKKAADDARKAKHQRAIETIRSYAVKAVGLPSERIAAGVAMLEGMRFGAEWEEFAALAVIAQTETLQALRDLLQETRRSEDEARERLRQQEENARVAAELKTQQEAMAAQQAQILAQQEAMAAQQRELERRAAELAQQQAAQQAAAAKAAAEKEAVEAAIAEAAASCVPAPAVSAPADPQPALQFEAPAPAAVAAARQVLLERLQEPAAPAQPQEEPTMKLGDVNAELGPGITMSEAFVCETLGIPKATTTGGRAVLFLPSQLDAILVALAKHALSKRRPA